jgi:hypothetical protein
MSAATRRDAIHARVAFWSVLGVVVVTCAVVCAWEPVQGDGWGHFTEARTPLTWSRFVDLARWYHTAGNPRWGQLALTLTFAFPAIASVVSSLMIAGVVVASMTLVRARWPRPSARADTWLLVQVVAGAMLTTPQFGAIWFYRPNCTNYLYPLAVQLAWLVPYRLLAARRSGRRSSRWTTPIAATGMLVLGAVAGAGNEHTGVGLGVGACVFAYAAYRRDRGLPLWAITGVIGLVLGTMALLDAPGQLVRYGGLGGERSALGVIVDRGVTGNLGVLGAVIAWASPLVVVVVCCAGRELRATWWRARKVIGDAGVFLAIAGVMVATLLASPKQPSRLLVAPEAMIAVALGVIVVELGRRHAIARRLRIVFAATVVIGLAGALAIARVTSIEAGARIARLDAAAPGAVVHVPRYTFSAPTPWSWGDDLRSAELAARVAQMFGLARIVRD